MNSATHVGKSGKIRKQPAHVHSGMNTISWKKTRMIFSRLDKGGRVPSFGFGNGVVALFYCKYHPTFHSLISSCVYLISNQ
jgi:hypothetical protein